MLGGTTRTVNTWLPLLACSGPGAQATIAQSATIGRYCAAMSGVIAVALLIDHLRRRAFSFRMATAVILFAIHPAWWMGVTHGDCGFMLRYTSYSILGILGGILLYHFYATRRAA